MRSFYLRFHVYATFCNISSNLQSSLVFLYANSLYASIYYRSVSLQYNEGNTDNLNISLTIKTKKYFKKVT